MKKKLKRIGKVSVGVDELRWDRIDELPPNFNEQKIRRIFKCSRVINGTRMFPYIWVANEGAAAKKVYLQGK